MTLCLQVNSELFLSQHGAAQLHGSGISTTDATRYAKMFHDNHFTYETFLDLSKSDLIDLGMTILSDIKIILHLSQIQPTTNETTTTQRSGITLIIHIQSRNFKMDWNVLKQITRTS